MKSIALVTTWAMLAAISIGCGSSEPAQAPMDMNQMAAATSQRPKTTDGTSEAGRDSFQSPASADRGDQEQAPVPDPNLATRRGFDLEDWSNEAAYVLVKADAAKIADALAQQWKGKVLKDVLGKPIDEERGLGVVYQLAGHPWSIFACDNSQLEELVPVLSRQADLLVFWNSDFNGWAAIEFHRAGEEVEAIHWGGVDEALGEDANSSLWHTEGTVTNNYEDGVTITDVYRFRSKLRKTTPAELQKGEAYVDSFMRHHDAYLPDADQMPWIDLDTKSITSPLGPTAFTAVHAVEVDSPE